MHLEIITPESKIFSGEAEAVQFPGLDGSFQVLDNHAAIISALAKGVVKANLNTAFSSPNSNELIKVDASDQLIDINDTVQFKESIEAIIKGKLHYQKESKHWAEQHDWSNIIKQYIVLLDE